MDGKLLAAVLVVAALIIGWSIVIYHQQRAEERDLRDLD